MSLRDPENVTFTVVSVTTLAVEDAEEGLFAQATEVQRRGGNG